MGSIPQEVGYEREVAMTFVLREESLEADAPKLPDPAAAPRPVGVQVRDGFCALLPTGVDP
jgi:hypothetical protein